MNWCPRCDILTLARPGELCDTCGAEIADITPLRSPRRTNGRQLLELDHEPIALDDVDEHDTQTSAPKTHRRVKRITALILALATVATASTAYTLSQRHPSPQRALRTPHISTPTHAPASPPFGAALVGKLALVTDQGLTLLDLTTGDAEHVDLPQGARQFTPSPDERMTAFVDANNFLYVYPGIVHTELRIALAGDVVSFSWTRDSKRIIVARRLVNARGQQRYRIESIEADPQPVMSLAPVLMYEGYLPVTQVFEAGKHLLFATYKEAQSVDCCYEPGSSGVYSLNGTKPGLVLNHYSVRDVSQDGRTALVSPDGRPGLFLLDIASRRLLRVGKPSLEPATASFGPGGAAVIVGNGHVWSLDLRTLKLKQLADVPAELGGWEPTYYRSGRWIAFISNTGYVVVSLDTGKLTMQPVDAVASLAFI
jgi:hypothetical protein